MARLRTLCECLKTLGPRKRSQCIGGDCPLPLYRLLQLTVPSRTWVLTSEPVLEPPELLKKECERAGLGPDDFLVPALGETVLF